VLHFEVELTMGRGYCAILGVSISIFVLASPGCGSASRGLLEPAVTTQRELNSEGWYCLNRPSENGKRTVRIQERQPAFFDSGADHDYEIVHEWPDNVASHVKIDVGDLFELEYDPARQIFNLRHVHSPGSNPIIHTAVLMPYPAPPLAPNEPMLWAWGRALDKDGMDAGGEYFVYSRRESLLCKHRHQTPGHSCKSVLFEFFLDGHAKNEKPSYPGVLTPYDSNPCEAEKETQEGDGDHGPNH
jgi:hypothetical protein